MNRVLQVVLTGNASNLKGVLASSAAEVKGFTRTVEQSNNSVAASATRAATGMKAMGIGAGVLAIALGYGVAKAAELEASMRNVNSLAKLSEGGLKSLTGQVIEMSTRLPQSAHTLAEGLYDVVGSGFSAGDALTVLNAAATAASAGLTTTEVSARAISGVLNAYGLKARDAADVSDILFQTVNLGVLSFDELAGSIGDTVGTAAAAKVGIDQVGAAIATMTLTGISGAESATSLNNLLQSMLKPSAALADTYKDLGYASGEQALKTDGLRVVMEKLQKATGGSVTSLLALFPNIRAARGALALMSNEGKNYARVSAELEDKNKRQGATAAVLKEQMKAATNQMSLLKNQFDAGAISVGTKVLPMLTGLIHALGTVGGFVGDAASDISHRLTPAWALLVQVGHDVWSILGDIYDAGSPVVGLLLKIGGGAAIGAITLLATALASITGFLADNKTIALALAGVLALNLAGGFAGVQAAAWRFIGTPVVLFLSNVLGGAGALAAFLRGGLTGAFATARGAALTLVATLAPLAVAAVLVKAIKNVVDFTHAGDDAKTAIEAMDKSLKKIDNNADRFKATSDAIKEARDKIADYKKVVDSFQNESLIHHTLIGQFTQDPSEVKDAQDSLTRYKAELFNLESANLRVSQSTDFLAKSLHLSKDKVQELADKYGIDLTGSVTDSIGAFIEFNNQDVGAEKEAATGRLVEALGVLADEASTAEERVKALKEALDALGGKQVSVFEATSKLQEVVASATGALDGLSGATLDAGGHLNAYTESGRKAGDILVNVRDKGNDLITTMVDHGATIEEVRKADAGLRESFIKTATTMGISKEAANKLADEILGVPKERETRFMAAVGDAEKQIKDLQRQIDALKGRTVSVNINTTEKVVTAYGTSGRVAVPLGYVGRTAGFEGGINGLAAAPPWTSLRKFAAGGTSGRGGEWEQVAWTPGGPMPTVPMIAKEHPGVGLINWAEPGTGGEALIPMGMQNRERSKRLVEYLAREFGMKSFADGGLTPAASRAYQPTVHGGGSVGYSTDAPVFEIKAEVRVGDRVITDLVDSRVTVKLKETVRTARAAGRGRN